MDSIRILIAGIAVVAVGCSGGPAAVTPAGATPTPAVTAVPTAVPSPTFAGEVIDISSKDRVFSLTEMAVAAGSEFEIRYENLDPYNHAIYISPGPDRPADTSEAGLAAVSLFRGEYLAGPVTVSYRVPALPAGTYHFFCPPHVPMSGILVVR